MTNTKEMDYVKWLRIAYLVNGGLMLFVALFPFIHLTIGILMLTGAIGSGSGEDMLGGLIFTTAAIIFIVLGSAISVMNFLTARYLKAYKNHTFCLVAGAVSSFFSPLGIILGIFTFLVLLNENVKGLFQQIPARDHFEPVVNQMPDWR